MAPRQLCWLKPLPSGLPERRMFGVSSPLHGSRRLQGLSNFLVPSPLCTTCGTWASKPLTAISRSLAKGYHGSCCRSDMSGFSSIRLYYCRRTPGAYPGFAHVRHWTYSEATVTEELVFSNLVLMDRCRHFTLCWRTKGAVLVGQIRFIIPPPHASISQDILRFNWLSFSNSSDNPRRLTVFLFDVTGEIAFRRMRSSTCHACSTFELPTCFEVSDHQRRYTVQAPEWQLRSPARQYDPGKAYRCFECPERFSRTPLVESRLHS